MIDNSRVILENNVEYVVIEKIKKDDVSYIYLLNPKDEKDFCVRKEIAEEDDNYLIGLDDKEEFDLAIKLYLQKHPVN